MTESKKSMPTDWVDSNDAPEITDAFFQQADEYQGQQLIRRGRPKAKVTKEYIGIRLSSQVLATFRAMGSGWQTRIDEALKEWIQSH